ncbi:MAG: hypothetical protein GX760_03550 [Erysipelothrix sp.]|nr:hypothetical protein [Erysipelothrix sp.]
MRNKTVLIAFLSALLIVSKELLSAIPNVELVSLLIIVYTYTVGLKTTLSITVIFTLVQAFIYPPHLWIITYLIIWPLLAFISSLLQKVQVSTVMIALTAGLFGLAFGAIDSVTNIILYGPTMFLPMWIRGLPWDIIHAISNYLTVLLLFNPIVRNLEKILTTKGN